MALGGTRNREGLDGAQIERCELVWDNLGGPGVCPLDVSSASLGQSRTVYSETRRVVVLGCDAYPGSGADPRSRMSVTECLAHELAHAERHSLGIVRPLDMPDYLLEEAEASVHAAFNAALTPFQRRILIEDARDQLDGWLTEP